MNQDQWYALYTRSRHEKFIHSELSKRNIESFLPLRSIKKRWSDRTVVVQEPLFKSYLFVRTNAASTKSILRTKGAVRFVSAESRPVAVPNQVIHTLQTAAEEGTTLDPFPYLKKGDRVYIRSGIFKGTEGFIIRKDDRKCRVVISIDAIMASVSIEIDAYLAEKI